jgi:subtilisin family serine protease
MRQPRRNFLLLILAVLALAVNAQQARWQKLSPMLRQLVRQQMAAQPAAARSSSTPDGSAAEVCAFVRLTDAGVLADYGCRDLAGVGNIHIVSIPIDRLDALSLDRRVERLEARPVGQTLLDTVATVVSSVPVYEGRQLPQAFTGRGVTVGLMDIGFDLTHPTFFNRDTTGYRISCLWDMLSTDTVGSNRYVGRDYVGRESLLSLGCSYDGREQAHGTHTAGIAAGSGYDSAYRGLAPESDISLVANATGNNSNLIDSALYHRYTFATDALGFKYLFDSARRDGQPCVVSFSEGAPQDFWGYDQLYYEMLDSLLGPGCIMVSAAGNNGYKKTWFSVAPDDGPQGMFISHDASPMLLTVKSADDFSVRLVRYASASTDTLTVTLHDVCLSDDSLLVCHTSETDSVLFQAYPNCYDPAETCIDMEFCSDRKSIGIAVPLSLEILDNRADVECWYYNGLWTTNALNPRLTAGEPTHSIVSPASAPRVICVGATTYRDGVVNHQGRWLTYWRGQRGRLAPYSAVGPTMDGRTKPDVVAPGNYVVSSYNSYFLEHNPTEDDLKWDVSRFDFNGRTYGWHAAMGTSMACPVVAGVVALWLQAKPDLTPEDVMDVIRRTSRQPDPALTYPNNYYGYGEIDAYRGLLDILGLDRIERLSTEHTRLPVTLQGRQLNVRLLTDDPVRQLTMTLYGVDGRLVRRVTGAASMNLDGLSAGVYALQLDGLPTGGGSTLIRLGK